MTTDSNLYAPGGAIHATISAKYGAAAANALWDAASREEFDGEEGAINEMLTRIKFGKPLDESFWSNLGEQLTTNPFAAPLESANRGIQQVFLDFLKNPWVIVALVVLVFAWAGGFQWLGRMLKGKFA